MTVLHFCSGSMFKNILILTRTRTKGEMRLLRLQRKNPLSVRNNFQNDANDELVKPEMDLKGFDKSLHEMMTVMDFVKIGIQSIET